MMHFHLLSNHFATRCSRHLPVTHFPRETEMQWEMSLSVLMLLWTVRSGDCHLEAFLIRSETPRKALILKGFYLVAVGSQFLWWWKNTWRKCKIDVNTTDSKIIPNMKSVLYFYFFKDKRYWETDSSSFDWV